jgi:plasmid stabilization system protein ParE
VALRLRIAAQARRDAGRILGWVARENPQAARNLADALERGIMRLTEYPLSAPLVANRIHPATRQLIVPLFRVLYRVTDPDLFIVGIMRCEQDLKADRLEGV